MSFRTIATRVGAALFVVTTVVAPASASINGRQADQQHRIAQGWRSGELSRGEASRLERQQYRIAQTEHRMRATGGGLSPAERARLHDRQDRASADIYGQKHDGRVR